ncbi:hypothetical protein OIO90_004075 [Microbotryomycetes sp. JL221]|nr:hypothetical protein OIO90_004075 [Microbotryomycetes sp. JL221]
MPNTNNSVDLEKHEETTFDAIRRTVTPGGHPVDYSQPAIPSFHRKFGNPAPLGLTSFGAGFFLVSAITLHAQGVTIPNVAIPVLLFYGGIFQSLVGMWEMAIGNTYGATVFASYGAFNLTYAGLYLPALGVAQAYLLPDGTLDPQFNQAIGLYLIMWMMVTIVFIIGSLRSSVAVLTTLVFTALAFLTLAINSFSPSDSARIAGGSLGMLASLCSSPSSLIELMGEDHTTQIFNPIAALIGHKHRTPAGEAPHRAMASTSSGLVDECSHCMTGTGAPGSDAISSQPIATSAAMRTSLSPRSLVLAFCCDDVDCLPLELQQHPPTAECGPHCSPKSQQQLLQDCQDCVSQASLPSCCAPTSSTNELAAFDDATIAQHGHPGTGFDVECCIDQTCFDFGRELGLLASEADTPNGSSVAQAQTPGSAADCPDCSHLQSPQWLNNGQADAMDVDHGQNLTDTTTLNNLFKGLDPKTVQEILNCCCCVPELQTNPQAWDPLQHASHTATHDALAAFNFGATDSLGGMEHRQPSIQQQAQQTQQTLAPVSHRGFGLATPHSSNFAGAAAPQALYACRWADCPAAFANQNELVEHVNAVHMTTLLPQSPADVFDLATLATRLSSSLPPIWASSDLKTSSAALIMLQQQQQQMLRSSQPQRPSTPISGSTTPLLPPPLTPRPMFGNTAQNGNESNKTLFGQMHNPSAFSFASPQPTVDPSASATNLVMKQLIEDHLSKLDPQVAFTLLSSLVHAASAHGGVIQPHWPHVHAQHAQSLQSQQSGQDNSYSKHGARPKPSTVHHHHHPRHYKHLNGGHRHVHSHSHPYGAAAAAKAARSRQASVSAQSTATTPGPSAALTESQDANMSTATTSTPPQPNLFAVSDPSTTSTSVSPPTTANGDVTTAVHECKWGNCQLTFSTTSDLMQHLSLDHVGSGKKWYVCEWRGCARGTNCNHTQGEEHGEGCEMGDNGEGEIKTRGFAQRQKIMRHLQTHTGDRPFSCQICGKAFSESLTLTQHMRVHTQEKPYKCTFPGCEKSFALASGLTIHMRTHTGDKPFVCPHPGCNAAFSESSNLSKHIRTHRGEKSYVCEQCDKRFARSDQLTRHRKTLTGQGQVGKGHVMKVADCLRSRAVGHRENMSLNLWRRAKMSPEDKLASYRDRKPPIFLRYRSSTTFIAITIWLGLVVDTAGYGLVVPVIPYRLQELGYDSISSRTGWLVAAYAGGLVVSSPPVAWLGSMIRGKRIPLIISLLFMAGATILFMETTDYTVLVVARVLQGFSGTGIFSLGLALITESVPEERLGFLMGIVMSGYSAGQTIGPPVGGVLYDRLGYRAPFIFSLILIGIDALLRLAVIEKHVALKWIQAGHDIPGFESPYGLQTTPTTATDATVVNNDNEAKEMKGVAGYRAGITEIAPLSKKDDERAKTTWRGVLHLVTDMRPVSCLLYIFIEGIAIGGLVESGMTLKLEDHYGLSSLGAGLAFIGLVVPTILASPIAGWFSDKFSAKWVVVIGAVMTLPAYPLLIINGPLPLFIFFLAVLGVTMAMFITPCTHDLGLVTSQVDGLSSMWSMSAFNLAYSLGAFIGPIMVGQVLEKLGVERGWMVMCIALPAFTAVCLPFAVLYIGGPLKLRSWTAPGTIHDGASEETKIEAAGTKPAPASP